MALVDSLSAWGVRLAPDVIEIAGETGLPIHIAAALLEQESGGGYNVWGNDPVSTGGAYVKGADVTRAAYEQYRRLCDAGVIGSQGVGPCQLTSRGYQLEADAQGGCWDPRANMLVGFRALANLIRQYGVDGIRRYNGSGPMAETYLQQMLAKAGHWAARLGSSNSITASPPTRPVPSPTSRTLTSTPEDEPMTPIHINIAGDGSFRGASICEAGTSSAVIAAAWVVFGMTWGSADLLLTFLGADGLGMGPNAQYNGPVGNNGTYAIQAPDGCKIVTVEGRIYGAGAVPTAAILAKAK